jgi:hypothetical protein
MYTFPPEVWDTLSDEFDLRADYSGRGMFGACSIGLTGQAGDLLRFAAAGQRTADEFDLPGEQLVDALAATVRSENRGYDLIFYFPGVEVGTDSDSHHTAAGHP